MKSSTLRRFSLFGTCVGALLLVAGCNGTTADITGLDILNTIFLGVTAAGGVAILRNV